MKILLLGGSKSGKSGLAQRFCVRLARWCTHDLLGDDGASGRRGPRPHRPPSGRARGLGLQHGRVRPALERAALPERACVLFDSVTALLANEMFSGAQPDAAAPERAAQELLALSCRAAHLVCVCDDIFRDGAAYDEWTERYRSGLARVCRTLAAEFDTVCEVTAGLPHLWKGELP